MRNILIIAKREINRLMARFSGGSRLLVFLILVGALVVSYLVSQQGSVLGKGIYRVGVSPGGPIIEDSRFSAIAVARSVGHALLDEGAIDVYVDGNEVASRRDARSLYAAGALKQSLERLELVRLSGEYEIDRAFPLRIEVNYLPASTSPPESEGREGGARGPSLSELVNTATSSPPESAGADSGATDAGPAQATSRTEGSATDSAVREQIKEMQSGSRLPEIKLDFREDKEIIVPSLMSPPMPFAQIVVAFLYVIPVFFVSVFFTTSFMTEKTERRITVLMSAPVTPFEIIAGKMLPYMAFSLASVVVVSLFLKSNLLLAMAIFIPVILFIFAVYLIVPLVYRTFKDVTFISMLAISAITSYLIFPAMFSGVNDLSYMSPLTLAVQMFRGEPFGLREYLFATASMSLVFVLSVYIGSRILNEEYLMGFRPLHRKAAEAIYLAINRSHIHASITLLSLFLIPVAFMIQLVALALSFNLPMPYALGGLLLTAAVIEEVTKSAGIAVLLEKKVVKSVRDVLVLSLLSALGFLVAEKFLLYISLGTVSRSTLSVVLFSSGTFLIPLTAHFVFTAIVCLLTSRLSTRYYPLAVFAGAIVHALYNLAVLGVIP
jgi:ABC-type Na+ efflux pump permease subunit